MSDTTTAFQGFNNNQETPIPIPQEFFQEVLPKINHLGELKVLLYVFWRMEKMESDFRYLLRTDFVNDAHLMQGFGPTKKSGNQMLDEALEKAETDGFLLKAILSLGDKDEVFYFLNTPRGRAAVEAIARGEWRYSDNVQTPITLENNPPNIYRLYEENIGPLTPMIADMLRDAEETYPVEWIGEAVHIAVEKNARNLRYVVAILNRWKNEGRDERKDSQDTEKARREYLRWVDPNLR